MLTTIRTGWREYPRQFWLMFFGMLVSTIGSSMIWPFLMVYVSGKLEQPLTLVATLLTINSAVGLVANFVAGPITDRFGRKWVLVIALLGNSVVFLLQDRADTFAAFAFALGLSGAFNPMYRVAADAMMADLIPREKRADAYSLMRMSNNLGIALGPAIGGFIASRSYSIAFILAAAGMFVYGVVLAFQAKETLPSKVLPLDNDQVRSSVGGYGVIFRDGKFLSIISAFTFCMTGSAILWILLSVYAKNHFNIPESMYGFIPATNAIMVVLFQIAVTRFTRRYESLPVMAVGALLYAIGVGSVALGAGFWGFWTSMVILSVGELVLIPTTTTFVANSAPADMRGRYMSIYNLSSGIAMGIGPVLGGFLSDTISPRSTWIGGFIIGIISPIMFLALWQYSRRQKKTSSTATPA